MVHSILFCRPPDRRDRRTPGRKVSSTCTSGVAKNHEADVSVSETTSSGTTSAAASIDLSSSTEFGIRFGAWHPTYNWVGLGMDLGYLHAEAPGVDITAFPMTILLAAQGSALPDPGAARGEAAAVRHGRRVVLHHRHLGPPRRDGGKLLPGELAVANYLYRYGGGAVPCRGARVAGDRRASRSSGSTGTRASMSDSTRRTRSFSRPGTAGWIRR